MPKKFFDIVPPRQKIKSFTKKTAPKERNFPTEKEPEIPKIPFWEEKKEQIPAAVFKTQAERKPKMLFLKGFFFSLALLLIIGFAGYAVFSKTDVEIWPKTDVLQVQEEIAIDSEAKEPDFAQKTIPGNVLNDQKSGSQDFPATGKVLKEEKASGIIRVYNTYSENPQGLWVSTRFVSSDGKLFRSVKKETIPGRTYDKGKIVPGYVDIEVQAAEAGEDYNIGPSTFSIPGFAGTPQYSAFYGKSFSPMTGGLKGEVAQVSDSDLQSAKNALSEKLKNESKEFLKNTVPSDSVLLEDLIFQSIAHEDSSVGAGGQSGSFNVQTEIKSEGLAFKKEDVENFARNFAASRVPKGDKMQEESLDINYSVLEKENNRAVVVLTIKAKIYPEIDLAEFKKAIADKSFQEVTMLVNDQTQIEKIKIKSSPFWKRTIPENLDKIELRINLGD